MKVFSVKSVPYVYGGGMAIVAANSVDEVKSIMSSSYKCNWNDDFNEEYFEINELKDLSFNGNPGLIDQKFYFE